MNQILNFGGEKTKASFATLEYCLLYNYGEILKPYTFCMFKTPLKVVQSTLPSWLATDLNLTNPQTVPSQQASFNTYRRKSFDDIFNFFMRGVINVYVYSTPDPYLIGTEQHFDTKKTQNATKPAYFQTTSKILSGGTYSTFNSDSGNVARGLKNVKCYPIDLVTQVDSDGNIFIDEKTNKPINIKDVIADDVNDISGNGMTLDFDVSGNRLQASTWIQTQSRVRFIIAFSIIFLILVSIIIVLVVYIFRGTSFGNSNTPAFLANAAPPPLPTFPPPMRTLP